MATQYDNEALPLDLFSCVVPNLAVAVALAPAPSENG
jgi:hypothetical protein